MWKNWNKSNCVYMYIYEKTMYLFILKLFVNLKCFGFYITPSLGKLSRDVVSSELYFILLLNWNKNRENLLTFYLR